MNVSSFRVTFLSASLEHRMLKDSTWFFVWHGDQASSREGCCEILWVMNIQARVGMCRLCWPIPARRAGLGMQSALRETEFPNIIIFIQIQGMIKLPRGLACLDKSRNKSKCQNFLYKSDWTITGSGGSWFDYWSWVSVPATSQGCLSKPIFSGHNILFAIILVHDRSVLITYLIKVM